MSFCKLVFAIQIRMPLISIEQIKKSASFRGPFPSLWGGGPWYKVDSVKNLSHTKLIKVVDLLRIPRMIGFSTLAHLEAKLSVINFKTFLLRYSLQWWFHFL